MRIAQTGEGRRHERHHFGRFFGVRQLMAAHLLQALEHLVLDPRNIRLARLESERREAGRAVIAAQERERRRIAQDLHDEVNQALTGILLRLEATISDASPALRLELKETKLPRRQGPGDYIEPDHPLHFIPERF